VSSPADLLARRVAYLRAGGEPNAPERRWAVIFDLGVAYRIDARALAPQQLAIAMTVSTMLANDPAYQRALAEARKAKYRPAVGAVGARIVAGEPVLKAEVDRAIADDHRRAVVADARVAAVAMCVRSRCARVRRLWARGAGRPRSRRTRGQARSSSRAGDSGDPEPAGGRLARVGRSDGQGVAS
jgi:hypothetical protein